jgi:hypothetical protein
MIHNYDSDYNSTAYLDEYDYYEGTSSGTSYSRKTYTCNKFYGYRVAVYHKQELIIKNIPIKSKLKIVIPPYKNICSKPIILHKIIQNNRLVTPRVIRKGKVGIISRKRHAIYFR